MRYRELTDPFFEHLPPLSFVEDLKQPMHQYKPSVWNARSAAEGEVFLPSLRLCPEFPDPDGLLDTIYTDFRLFLSVYGHDGGACPIRTVQEPTDCPEAYRVTVTEAGCTVSAGDTEGIRRALVWIEDEMHRREGSFLPAGTTARKPYIRTRITRCFFSPTNRPPKNGEELADDVDYYPEGYLNRLMHDGVNGVWIYTHFRDLVPSQIIPEYGTDYQRRIDKLNRTVERCARYGIRVYLLGVEPASTYHNPILLQHPELLGQYMGAKDFYGFCTGTPEGLAYAEECTRTLFTLVPGLAGFINISVGESISHCASGGGAMEIDCPNCAGKTRAQILTECEAAMARGMHAVKPEAEMISWTYGQRDWDFDAAHESCRLRDDGVILMQNFEDWGEVEQLGKPRLAMDYWLSYVGPGKLFDETAHLTRQREMPMYAKLQVCNSHEVATVPYVPVPGILYKKYRYLYTHGISGVMQCWYFGNYPSIMSKAASELSFQPFFPDEDSFLHHLAGIYWGSDAAQAVQAWKQFEAGYTNFPVNVLFEWFSPMQDGPVWPLHLEPVDLPLSSTWKSIDMVGGDRLGECLQGHTHAEALELSRRMLAGWQKGLPFLLSLEDRGEAIRQEQKSVAQALALLFESGTDIFEFYQLRDQLGMGLQDPEVCLIRMEQIVRREIQISRELSALWEADHRLGYHSEAEGHKYFPEKLAWRIRLLEQLLETEFVRTRARIAAGEPPLPFYYGLEPDAKRYPLCANRIEDAVWDSFVTADGQEDPCSQVRMAADSTYLYLQLRRKNEGEFEIRPEWTLFHPHVPVWIGENGPYFPSPQTQHNLYGERQAAEIGKWCCTIRKYDDWQEYTLRLRKEEFPLVPGAPMRFDIRRNGACRSSWGQPDRIFQRLGAGTFSPDALVFVIPDKP